MASLELEQHGLAWEHANFDAPVRLGVITGSLLSAAAGSLVLRLAARGGNNTLSSGETGNDARKEV